MTERSSAQPPNEPDFSSPRMTAEARGPVAVLRFTRPEKRNAVNEEMIRDLERFFGTLASVIRVVVMTGSGGHFCAGLDLAEHKERDAAGVVETSRLWHRVLEGVEFGGRPVVAAMEGAVIGGGLEIASAAHVRVADTTAFYQLPEGRRGIFVGGGASVRTTRIIGTGRVVEMMLTGRTLDAETGQRLGLSHEVVAPGACLARALELADTIASNAPLSNQMILQALPRIADMPMSGGYLTEALATALTQTSPDARRGIRAFLEKRRAEFGGPDGDRDG